MNRLATRSASLSSSATLACLATAAALVSGCAGWMGPRTVEVPREDIQAKLDQKFPITRQVLGYIDITASHPQLTMLPETNRVSASIDLKLDDTMFRKVHEGQVQASFGLRYEPGDRTVRLDQVKLDELSLPTLSPVFLDTLQRLGNQAARDVLQGYVIKQFKPEDLRQADRLGYQVAGLRVTAKGLAIDLTPKTDAPRTDTASADATSTH